MRRFPLLLALLAALALVAPQAAAPSTSLASAGDCTPAAEWPAANGGFAAEVVALVNEHRASLGLGGLAVSSPLTGSAVWKARHMAEYSYMAHNDPAPPVARGVGERLSACGYSGSGWAENIAYGYPTPEQVVAAWLASGGHRANIENPSYVAIGVGAAVKDNGVVYWAQDFGTKAGGSPPPATPDPDPPPANDPPAGGSSGPPSSGGTELVVPSAPGAETPDAPSGGTPAAAPDESGAPQIELASLRVKAGKAMSSNPSSLEADDLRSLVVRSRAGRTAWRASFGLPDEALEAESLRLTYRGASTLACRQTISVWSFARKAWVALDSRRIASRETEIAIEIAIGQDQVSANGNVLIRVLCQRNGSSPFSTRADLLTIAA